MKNSVAVLMLVATLVVGSDALAGGKGANPNGKPFVELQGQIIEVEGEIATLQDQIESLVGRVDSLEGEQAATNAAIAALEAQNAFLQDQIDANADDISSIENEIAALEEENQLLQAQVDANSGDIEAAQAQVDANNGLISSLQQSLSELGTDLQAQIDNNTSLIDAMQSNIVALEGAIVMKQNVINGYCPDGSAIRQVLSDGSVECEHDDTGSGPGTLEATRVSKQIQVPPGSAARISLSCPEGWLVTSAGWLSYGFELAGCYTIPPRSGLVDARNLKSYSQNLFAYAQCIRIVP